MAFSQKKIKLTLLVMNEDGYYYNNCWMSLAFGLKLNEAFLHQLESYSGHRSLEIPGNGFRCDYP